MRTACVLLHLLVSICVVFFLDFVDGAGGMGVVKTVSISTSWSNREKSSDVDHDHLDPLFHSASENFHDQAFDDSDEEESSGMYCSVS